VRRAAVAGCFLFAAAAHAAPPSGHIEVPIGAPAQIFELQQHLHLEIPGQTAVVFEVDVAADGLARVTGGGLVDFLGDVSGACNVDVSGKVSGTVTKPNAQLALSFTGPVAVLGVTGDAKGSLRLRCGPSEGLGSALLDCKGSAKVCAEARGKGHACGTAQTTTTLATIGGDWTLVLDLATDENGAITGSAVAALGTTEAPEFVVTGKYDARKDVSTLKFTAVSPLVQKLVKLSLKNFAPGASGTLRFKIGGMTGAADLAPAP
jgi:hypothetical protein